MPVALAYSDVYVEEMPSGVRPIGGVAASITAFGGRARRGPTDGGGPVVVNSYTDHERMFGGLWLESPMWFTRAIVVRLHRTKTTADTVAKAPGGWGRRLCTHLDAVGRQHLLEGGQPGHDRRRGHRSDHQGRRLPRAAPGRAGPAAGHEDGRGHRGRYEQRRCRQLLPRDWSDRTRCGTAGSKRSRRVAGVIERTDAAANPRRFGPCKNVK